MSSTDKQKHALRFGEMPGEHGQMLLPIEGYGKMPLVTLEKAVEPLVSIVHDIHRMVWLVKQNCGSPSENLSSDESASIMLYSLEWQPREKSLYMILNKTLPNKNRVLLKPWLLYLKLILAALSKLPSQSRILHRGIRKDVLAEYMQEKTFVWWGFSSCTSSIDVLKNETFLGKTGTRTLFTIDCHSGKDIRQHSMCQTEDEVLLLPARQFQVVSCMNAGNDLHLIHIKEIDPSYPLLEPLLHTPALTKSLSLMHNNAPYHNEHLEQMIGKCPPRMIKLYGQSLNEKDMQIVIKQGIIDKQCSRLELTACEITPRSIAIFADALYNNQCLEELNLSYNRISDLGVRYLASKINGSVLKRIDLTENDVSSEGANYLADMLCTNTILLELSLSENQIGNTGVQLLAKALAHSNKCLEVLNLSANSDINDESIDSLIDAIKHNRTLKKLDLRHNNLSRNGEERLSTIAKSKLGFQIWLSHLM